jgi:hypothetical protein
MAHMNYPAVTLMWWLDNTIEDGENLMILGEAEQH